MSEEQLEAELEHLDEQCQRMAHEYSELAKSHSSLLDKIKQLEERGDTLYYYLLGNSKITANQWEVCQRWEDFRNNRLSE